MDTLSEQIRQRQRQKWQSMKQARLLEIVRQNPGLNGRGLQACGYSLRAHGSLRDAERAGLIVYRENGWHVSE